MKIEKGTSRMARWLLAVVMAFGASVAIAQITTSRHNLGTTAGNPGVNKLTSGTAEICVFCHTPHAATAGSAPLWNKNVTAGPFQTYTTAMSSTLDGEVLPVGSISLACLSCHDGTQAMDNMVNAPGSGLAKTGTWTWTGGNQSAGQLTGVANLGTDLQNDHPIGIRYCGGGQDSVTPGGACADADFVAPNSGTVNSTQVWWVDTAIGASANRQKTDMILYNRQFAGPITAPSVECGSCHDPHVPTNGTFLRISNAGSGVCLACHNK